MINRINMSVNIWGSRDGVVSGCKYKHVPTDDDLGATSQNFLSIKDNNVDVKGSRIKNLNDPEDDGDAVNKRYVDTRKTKCYVGYIPYNLHSNGFLIVSTSTEDNSNLMNMFDNNLDSFWKSKSTYVNRFALFCPEEIIIRKVYIDCSITLAAISLHFDDVTGDEFYCTFRIDTYNSDNVDYVNRARSERIGHVFPPTHGDRMLSTTILRNRTDDNVIVYKGFISINDVYDRAKNYTFTFSNRFRHIVVEVKAFQLYVYND